MPSPKKRGAPPGEPAEPSVPSDSARLFFALWPEIGVRNELAAWQRKLQRGGNARVMRPWTFHLTLAFLGATPESLFDSVKDAGAAARGQSFEFVLDQAGYWPHNHLVWIGCSAPSPALVELQAALAAKLGAAGVAFDNSKAFHPHVTVLRNVRTERADLPQSIVAWPVRDFVLVESKPGADGSRYEIVARFPLR